MRGATAGAGIGATVAELAAMGVETSVGAPPTFEEFTQRTLTAGPEGAVAEFTGRGIGKAIARGFSGKVGELGKKAYSYLEGNVTPAQVTDSHALAVIENIMEGSLFGGGKYHKFLEQQQRLLKDKARSIVGEFGPETTMEEAGKIVRSAAEARVAQESGRLAGRVGEIETRAAAAGGRATTTRESLRARTGAAPGEERTGQLWQRLQEEAHRTAKESASALYDEVDTLVAKTGGAPVSLAGLKEFAEADAARRGSLGLALTGGKPKSIIGTVQKATEVPEVESELASRSLAGIPPSDPAHRVLMEALQESGVEPSAAGALEDLTFRQAHEVRSALGRIVRQAERSADPNANQTRGIASQMMKRIDQAMTEAAGGKDSPIRTAYDTATAAWKQMAQTFEEGLLYEVAGKEPRLVVRTLIQPGRVDDILKAKSALGPGTWRAVQAQHLDSILKDAKGDWVQGEELLKRLAKLKPETIEAVYGKSGAEDLSTLATALGEQGTLTKQAATLAKEGVPREPILSTPPYRTLASIIRPGSIEGIERAKQLVGTANWERVQSAHAQSLLFEGSGPEAALRSGTELMRRLNTLTPETLDAAYPRGRAQGLWQFARVLQQIQKPRPGTAKVWIQLAQAGAATGLFLGDRPEAAAAVLLTPLTLSRIILTPTARRYLILGMKEGGMGGKTTTAGLRAVTNLTTWLVREGLLSLTQATGAPARATPPPPSMIGEGGRSGGPGPRGSGGQGGVPPPPTFPGG